MAQFEGYKKGDRVRFEATVRDTAYSDSDLPTEYNGILGTLTENDDYAGAIYVRWDIPEIRDYPGVPGLGYRASFTDNLVVIERKPKTKTVTFQVTAKITGDEHICAFDIESAYKKYAESFGDGLVQNVSATGPLKEEEAN